MDNTDSSVQYWLYLHLLYVLKMHRSFEKHLMMLRRLWRVACRTVPLVRQFMFNIILDVTRTLACAGGANLIYNWDFRFFFFVQKLWCTLSIDSENWHTKSADTSEQSLMWYRFLFFWLCKFLHCRACRRAWPACCTQAIPPRPLGLSAATAAPNIDST